MGINVKDKFSSLARVEINNLYGWSLGYHSNAMHQDILIPPYAKKYKMITLADALEQVANNNVFWCGTDGFGSHAAIQIVDPELREYILNTTDVPVQFTKENIQKMLEHDTRDSFAKAMKETIVTTSEGRMMLVMLDEWFDKEESLGWKTDMLTKYCEELNRKMFE